MSPDTFPIHVLALSGSLRRASHTSALLRAARTLAPIGVDRALYSGLPASVSALRGEIARADAVVFCTPEYAGTLPGSSKNLLDWTVGGAEMYDKPTTWINVAAAGRGNGADATLTAVLGYIGDAVMSTSGVRVSGAEKLFPQRLFHGLATMCRRSRPPSAAERESTKETRSSR
jgi:chromate reductase, NAD(P)H dehydrogenase (quinone)